MKTTSKSPFPRTDLAQECVNFAQMDPVQELKEEALLQNGIQISRLTVEDSSTAQRLGKPIGRYITLSGYDLRRPPIDFGAIVSLLAAEIKRLMPNRIGPVLVIGLGNGQITPDAVGPRTVRYLLATRHLPQELLLSIGLTEQAVCAIAPGVLGQTGMEAAEVTDALAQTIKPCCILAVDALAAGSAERVGRTIQLCDSGIAPGAGVLNARKELTQETLGCPVIAIGVPTVIDLPNSGEIPMMVTPREVDTLAEHAGKIIGFAINRALHPDLSLEEITALVI